MPTASPDESSVSRSHQFAAETFLYQQALGQRDLLTYQNDGEGGQGHETESAHENYSGQNQLPARSPVSSGVLYHQSGYGYCGGCGKEGSEEVIESVLPMMRKRKRQQKRRHEYQRREGIDQEHRSGGRPGLGLPLFYRDSHRTQFSLSGLSDQLVAWLGIPKKSALKRFPTSVRIG